MLYQCQQSLITFLKAGLLNTNCGPAATIKEYAGELREAHKLTELQPCILVKYSDGFPVAQDAYNLFDLITVTDSEVFDKETNQNTNLSLASDVLEYIAPQETANNRPGIFNKEPGPGTYYISPEKIRAETILIIERFNIIKIQLYISDNTSR